MGNKISQDYGVMPQAKKNQESFVDFMQRTTWFQAMTTALQRHSEFMRPELADGFPDMEYGYPDKPNDPPWLPPEQEGPPDLNPKGACVISCYAPLYCNQPVKCHFSVSQTPPGMTPSQGLSNVQMTAWADKTRVSGDRLTLQSHQTDSVMDGIYRQQNSGEGGPGSGPDGRAGSMTRHKPSSIFPMEIWPPSTGWPEWPGAKSTKLKVCASDPSGNICCTTLSVFCRAKDCCLQSGYVVMTFDGDSTPDTIAPGGSITVYALNGCGPYTWSVSGSGYSFASATTTVLSNTLSLVDGVCGTGVGKAGPVGTVTITDSCGTSVQTKIRSTAGGWNSVVCNLQTIIPDNDCGAGCYISGGTTTVYYISEDTRWVTNMYSHTSQRCMGVKSIAWADALIPCGGARPPCGDPRECSGAHGGSCVPTAPPWSCPECTPIVNSGGAWAASKEGWAC